MSKIAVLGPKGTFSDSAFQKYCIQTTQKWNPLYFSTIEETFRAVGEECDYAIVPIENTLDGYVQRSLDLLLEMQVHIVTELTVPVQFSLVANAPSLDEIETLYVQFKSSGQCRKQINALSGVKLVITESNMESFAKVKKGGKGEAAIIPKHLYCKEDWDFGIEKVTDAFNNFTRFLVIQNGTVDKTNEMENKIKVPLYIMPAFDKPGILFQILKIFNDRNINLISIMSRPTKKDMGTYNFYIELSGEKKQWNDILGAIQDIKMHYKTKILGIYSI